MKYKLLHTVTLSFLSKAPIDLAAGTWVDFTVYKDCNTLESTNLVLDEDKLIWVLDLNVGRVELTREQAGTVEYVLLATCLMDAPMETLARYVALDILPHCDWQIRALIRNRLEGLI
jgi:hypothetical protein